MVISGLHERTDVIVIAATNRPDKIDPALLRPGFLTPFFLFILIVLAHQVFFSGIADTFELNRAL